MRTTTWFPVLALAIGLLSACGGGGGGGGGSGSAPIPPSVTLETVELGGEVPTGVDAVQVDGVEVPITAGRWSSSVAIPAGAVETTVEVSLHAIGNPVALYRRQIVVHRPQ